MFATRSSCTKCIKLCMSPKFIMHRFRLPVNFGLSYDMRRVSSSCLTLLNNLHFTEARQKAFAERPLLIREVKQHMECLMHSNLRLMAGHSKWQNIKHTKTAKDSAKSRMCNRLAHLARCAVRQNGPDPKLNADLRNVIEEARKHSIPLSTIENAMKKASSGKTKFGYIEIMGPGGCIIVLDYETENVSTMRHEIKSLLKKYNSNIMQGEGKWRAAFEKKGIINATEPKETEGLDPEKALDSAIEAGAENVQLKVDEDDNRQRQYLEFICDPNDLLSVKKELEGMQYKIEEAFIGFIPHINVQLGEEDMDAVGNLLSDLEAMEDVVRLFENVQQ